MLEEAKPGVVKIVHADVLDLDFDGLINEHWVDRRLTHSPDAESDILDNGAPMAAFPSRPAVQVLGNLPFGIATPLFINFLDMASSNTGVFCRGEAALTLAFQKEVALSRAE